MGWCENYNPLNVLAVLIGMAGMLLFLGGMCVAICFSGGNDGE